MSVPISQMRPSGLASGHADALKQSAGLAPVSEPDRPGQEPPAGQPAPRIADIVRPKSWDDSTAAGLPARRHALAEFLSARTVPAAALLAEFAFVVAASFGAGALYHNTTLGHLPSAEFYFGGAILLASMLVVPCGLARDYALIRLTLPREQARSVFLHWNSAYLLFAFLLFITHASDFYSRGALVAQYAAGLSAALLWRLALARLVAFGLRKGVLGGKSVVLVGEGSSVTALARKLRAQGRGVDILGVVRLPEMPERGDLRGPADATRGVREAAAEIEDIARRMHLDEIVISLPWPQEHRIRALVESLALVPACIHLAPDARAAWTHGLAPSRVGSLAALRLARAPLSLRDRVLKRAFDMVAGTVLLTVALPFFAIIAICIKLDSKGPVFFRQRRNGFNQSEFRILKFRTMTTLDDGATVRQATREDSRVTRVGRFLRRTNIDELPQLINVLAGEMSLVGPRPHALAHNNEYSKKIWLYARRHNVKPGITGLSQIYGYRGETKSLDRMSKRVEYDLRYIDSWSLFLDVKILASTLLSRKSFQNAY